MHSKQYNILLTMVGVAFFIVTLTLTQQVIFSQIDKWIS
jgi:hypothetical protein